MTAIMDQFEDLFIILVRFLCHLHRSPDQALDLWDLRHSRARSRVHLPSGLTIFSVWPPSCNCLMVTKWLHHLPPWVSNSQGEIRKKKQGERKLPDQESKPFQKPPGKCFICPHQWAKETQKQSFIAETVICPKSGSCNKKEGLGKTPTLMSLSSHHQVPAALEWSEKRVSCWDAKYMPSRMLKYQEVHLLIMRF